jgi:hypothetical protein
VRAVRALVAAAFVDVAAACCWCGSRLAISNQLNVFGDVPVLAPSLGDLEILFNNLNGTIPSSITLMTNLRCGRVARAEGAGVPSLTT